jgi:HEAT repeat protein
VLVAALRDPDASVRQQAMVLLQEVPCGVEPLLACLADVDSDVRAKAARALGRRRDPSAASALADAFIRAAREDDESVLRESADALKRLVDGATDHLLPALSDPAPNVRVQAAWMLGHAGNQRARDALGTLSADPEPAVREAALDALERLGRTD